METLEGAQAYEKPAKKTQSQRGKSMWGSLKFGIWRYLEALGLAMSA